MRGNLENTCMSIIMIAAAYMLILLATGASILFIYKILQIIGLI